MKRNIVDKIEELRARSNAEFYKDLLEHEERTLLEMKERLEVVKSNEMNYPPGILKIFVDRAKYDVEKSKEFIQYYKVKISA